VKSSTYGHILLSGRRCAGWARVFVVVKENKKGHVQNIKAYPLTSGDLNYKLITVCSWYV